jgi:glucokinase
MIIEGNGPKCSCGNNGCLEVMASGTAMTKEIVNRIVEGEVSLVTQLVQGKLDNVNAKIIGAAAKRGDDLACQVVNKIAYYLGLGLVNLVNIFNPQMIIIGGGVAKMGGMLLKPAKRVMKERAFKLPSRSVQIVRSRLGYDAGVLGAAAYVFDQQLNGVF